VRDNGRGIAAAELGKSTAWGLRGMRERAASLGGELDVAGAIGSGATITLLLPLPHATATAWSEEPPP
jgi:signal transduction histidine kinase